MSASRLTDIALAAALAEAAALVALRRRTRLGAADALRMLLPGALLMLGVRSAAAGGRVAPCLLAPCLLAALLAHLADLRQRIALAGGRP